MKLTLIAFLLAPLLSFAQKDSILTFSEVVTVDSVSKNELFNRARSWFNDVFKSSKDVIQILDRETGEIAGKGALKSGYQVKMMGTRTYSADYFFSLKIFIKEGKYKYEASNFDNVLVNGDMKGAFGVLTSSPQSPKRIPMVSQKRMDEYWMSAKENVEKDFNEIIKTLKVAMIKKTPDF